MSFLTIPSREGLLTATKADKSPEEDAARSRTDADGNNDDEDEDEDDAENVRLIPRCSPVPRKRGSSIGDETAEYMRIHLALSAGKRVSFADTTGGDLVDVREFHAFDSDEEEHGAKWEEEEAKYRKPERKPTYNVRPEFRAPGDSLLLQAVRSNKVEVEQISPSEDDPLGFSGLVRVLNVSFHKAVYIRSTMDAWASYFDYPAEYVQGSNDGETDQFSFKLCFAPPYTTHGSRTEFVVRYETSDGDYWANNCNLNYVVTLLLSYKDEKEDPAQRSADVQQRRSILKSPRAHSTNDGLASEEGQEKEEEEESSVSGLVRPTAVCPVFIQPEIDIETAAQPPGSFIPPNHEPPFVDSTSSTLAVFPGEPLMSSETKPQTNSTSAAFAGESVQPDKSHPSPRLQCELQNVSEQPVKSGPSALLPASSSALQESQHRSDESQDVRMETPAPEASALCPSAAEMKPMPTAGEDGSTELPLPAEGFSCTSETNGFERGIAVGLSVQSSEGSTRSAAHHVGSTPESLVAETVVLVGAEPQLAELTESPPMKARVTKVSFDTAPQAASSREDDDHISQHSLLEDVPNSLSHVSELGSEDDINRNLMPCVFFLSGVVSLSLVMQEPSALFFIGLLLVLHRL